MSTPVSPTTTAPHAADATPPDHSPPAAPGASRRGFLVGTGTLALAATAVATTARGSADPAGTVQAATAAAETGDLGDGTLVVYVRPGESEVTILAGDREVVLEDPALVRAIARRVGER